MIEFVHDLWPDLDRPGAFSFWLKGPGKDKTSLHVPLRDLANWDEETYFELLDHATEPPRNIYFGMGARVEGLTEYQIGKRDQIIAFPAFTLDIDLFDPSFPDAHVAKDLPRTIEEAAAFLEDLPLPTYVVHSGGGIQVHHLFDEPVDLSNPRARLAMQHSFRRWQAKPIAKAKSLGFHMDLTATITHVWRWPGSINRKSGRVATVIDRNPVRYTLKELGIDLPASGNSVDVPVQLENDDAPQWDYEPVDLERVYTMLKRISPKNRFYGAIQRMLEGESIAERGARDETLQGVASTIAWLEPCRRADPEVLADAFFRPSLEIWAAEEDAKLTIEEEMTKAVDKIARNQEDYEHKNKAKASELEALAKALGVNLDDGATESEAHPLRYLIVQYKTIFFVWDFTRNEYSRALIVKEVIAFIVLAWNNDVAPEGISGSYINDKGEEKQKTVDRLMREYGTVAKSVVGDMTIEKSFYDQTQRLFRDAMAQKRVTEAKYDPRIDDYLRVAMGSSYEKVVDWCACLTRLSEPCAALLLVGPPDVGKTALANAASRTFHVGEPTPLYVALNDFNDSVARCPVILADEGLPKRRGISEDMRRLIAAKNFTMNAKFIPHLPVIGSVRVIVAANNDRVLSTDGDQLSVEDLQAIADRYLYVRVQNEAGAWLKKHNVDNCLMTEWIEGDGFAKHCLYLAQNREVVKTHRFIVSGDETDMHRKLLMQSPTDALIFEWLARFTTDPERLSVREGVREGVSEGDETKRPMALVGNNSILVNSQGLLDGWSTYMINSLRPSTTIVGGALRRLSDGTRRLGPRHDRTRYHRVRTNLVLSWATDFQVGDPDKIFANVKKKNEHLDVDLDLEDELEVLAHDLH